jgi:GNAT superfamily N-acetyltransferase
MSKQLVTINSSVMDENICISIRHKIGLSVAELTNLYQQPKCWYFSRLFVKPAHRKLGYASLLVEEVIYQAVQNKANIALDINPYGDGGPNLAQLITFYSKHGFVLSDEGPNCMDFLWENYQPKS